MVFFLGGRIRELEVRPTAAAALRWMVGVTASLCGALAGLNAWALACPCVPQAAVERRQQEVSFWKRELDKAVSEKDQWLGRFLRVGWPEHGRGRGGR